MFPACFREVSKRTVHIEGGRPRVGALTPVRAGGLSADDVRKLLGVVVVSQNPIGPVAQARTEPEPARWRSAMWLYWRLFLVGLHILRGRRRDLILENLVLRRQLAVCERRGHRPRLEVSDRRFWSLTSRRWQPWRSHLHLVQLATVVGWHRTCGVSKSHRRSADGVLTHHTCRFPCSPASITATKERPPDAIPFRGPTGRGPRVLLLRCVVRLFASSSMSVRSGQPHCVVR